MQQLSDQVTKPIGQWGRSRIATGLPAPPPPSYCVPLGKVRRQMAKPGSPRSASNPPEELILDDQIEGDLVL